MSKTEISKLKSSTAGLRFHDLRHHAITDQRNHRRAIKPLWSLPGTRISPNAGSLLARAAGSEEDCTGRNLDTRSDRNRATSEANRYDTHNAKIGPDNRSGLTSC